ncbi:MAG: SLBB domain-containing protein [Gemmatimonadaceae bacterium]|nr:SLBB domain-containing protein [Gemmatimonadaceae bacterium]
MSAAGLPAQVAPSTTSMERAAQSLIFPGDQIVVRVAREPLLGDSVMVNERGEVSLPRIGTVNVGQLTIAGVRDTLLARYQTFLRDPVVNVQGLRRVTIQGAVHRPGVYHLNLATTLRDLIAQAGGLNEYGHTKKVAIVRAGAEIPVREWEREVGSAIDLRSGDQVVVGRKSWLALNALPVASTAFLFISYAVSLLKK